MADYRTFHAACRHLLRAGGLSRADLGNPPWLEAGLRVLIVRLSPYADVDRSTPHLFLAQEARRAGAEVFVDFCFFPGREDLALLEEHGVPLLTGITSGRSVDDFDLVLISCSFVLELLNLPVMLEGSQLALMASARAAGPVLVLGGSGALASQSVIDESGDAMVDAVFFGEGEGYIERLVGLARELRGAGKASLLQKAAAEIPGLWPAGSTLTPVRPAVCPSPGARDLVTSYPVLPGPEAATARLQISYGCPFACSFCFEGWGRKPYRDVPPGELLTAARALKAQTGARSLELSSFNFNTHPDLVRLLLKLNRLFAEVSFMSQRIDILADTPGLLEAEMAAGKRSFTLGVEGVSERQRRFMDKRLDEPRIRNVLSRLLAAGAREAKLFYLLSGHETEEDFAELSAFVGWLRGEDRAFGGRTRLVFSFNRLIRMPFTPLQFDRLLLDEPRWQSLLGKAKAVVAEAGYEMRVASSWPEYALSQVMSLGGRWLCGALAELARAGHVYQGEARPETWRAMRDWLEAHPHPELLGEKPPGYLFALSFVTARAGQEALYARFRAATAALAPLPAARSAGRQPVPEMQIEELRRVVRDRAALAPVDLLLGVPRAAADLGPEALSAWVTRELMSLDPALVEELLEVRELRLSGIAREHDGFWAPAVPWFGEGLFAIAAWRTERLLAVGEARAATPGGLRLLGAGEAAAGPPRLLRLRLHLAEELFPQAGPRLAEALNRSHVPVTARRDGGGWLLVPASRSRRVLAAGSCLLAAGAWCLELTVGPRFPLLPYLRSFGRGLERRALLEVLGIG